jgi:hypothetical protein
LPIFEKSLRQSSVTKSYVAKAFRTYIDDFSSVAHLTPAEAYRTVVDGTPTLFLFGRTRTAPYTFYYCSQPENLPWSPWQKIDLTINSPWVTPVYAFGRLFIFWLDIKKNSSTAIQTDSGSKDISSANSTVYRATLEYSFINQQGKWVQPQTLVKDQVVLFLGDPKRAVKLKNSDIFSDGFDLDDLVWQKIFALRVDGSNYASSLQPGVRRQRAHLRDLRTVSVQHRMHGGHGGRTLFGRLRGP